MKRRWVLADDGATAEPLARDCGLHPAIARILHNRGIGAADAARRFLDPRLRDLDDPMRLPDIDRAAERLWAAIRSREQIALYGDYDVDGVTSISLIWHVVTSLGGRAECFVPRRLEEGYGLTLAALHRCCESIRPSLVVAMDCGTTSVDEAEWLLAQGIDLIIADHHQLPARTPRCHAFVNPQRGQHDHHLCSAGIAFKLAHALLKVIGERCIDLRDHLDLVALGTIADIVPLVDDNRILARAGLARIAASTKPGLRQLLRVARVGDVPTTFDTGFKLAPRINAAGRLDDAMAAVRLLTTPDEAEASRLANELDARNRERQEIERAALSGAMARAERDFDEGRDHAIVMGDRSWHPGIIGLIASRLQQRFWRPTFIVAIDRDGRGKGSGRSVEGCHLVEGLRQCQEHLEGFGGHALAAGLYVRETSIPAFREAFNAWAGSCLRGELRTAPLKIDAEITFRDIDATFMPALASLAPFGQSNPEPLFLVRGVRLARPPTVVGENHLKLHLTQDGPAMDAMAFGMAGRTIPEEPFEIVASLVENSYWGAPKIEWRLRDFRPAP
ncbi:MAG TPA: single-stranded-DNA-specific exonuclease RecJ [Verrucomicrobiae bacterium]|nr:single-stranded-DNA-specific exonuclease RecJ [Verrucomicrobiae bacterium]